MRVEGDMFYSESTDRSYVLEEGGMDGEVYKEEWVYLVEG